jgi:hypothetical protein
VRETGGLEGHFPPLYTQIDGLVGEILRRDGFEAPVCKGGYIDDVCAFGSDSLTTYTPASIRLHICKTGLPDFQESGMWRDPKFTDPSTVRRM